MKQALGGKCGWHIRGLAYPPTPSPLHMAREGKDCYEPLLGSAAGGAVWEPGRACLSPIHDPRAKRLKNLSRRGQQRAATKAPRQGRDLPHKVCRPWVMPNLAPDQLAAYPAVQRAGLALLHAMPLRQVLQRLQTGLTRVNPKKE